MSERERPFYLKSLRRARCHPMISTTPVSHEVGTTSLCRALNRGSPARISATVVCGTLGAGSRRGGLSAKRKKPQPPLDRKMRAAVATAFSISFHYPGRPAGPAAPAAWSDWGLSNLAPRRAQAPPPKCSRRKPPLRRKPRSRAPASTRRYGPHAITRPGCRVTNARPCRKVAGFNGWRRYLARAARAPGYPTAAKLILEQDCASQVEQGQCLDRLHEGALLLLAS
jgi:hypothetical protein